MTDTEKAKAYDEAVAYAKRVLDCLAEDYRCTHMTKDDIINQYSRLFPHEEAFQDDEDSFAYRKLIYGLKSLIQQGKETFAGADITDLIDYLEKKQKPFKEPIDGVLYAAACGIKNKEQVEKSEKPSDGTVDVEDVAAEKAREYALSLPGGERTTAVGRTYSESGYYHGFVEGSNWQNKPKVSEGLEEEIREFVEQEWDGLHDNDGNPLYTADYLEYIARHFAKCGAEYAKEELMKEAVEIEVLQVTKNRIPFVVLNLDAAKYKDGDKVNIIILPKEDKQ